MGSGSHLHLLKGFLAQLTTSFSALDSVAIVDKHWQNDYSIG